MRRNRGDNCRNKVWGGFLCSESPSYKITTGNWSQLRTVLWESSSYMRRSLRNWHSKASGWERTALLSSFLFHWLSPKLCSQMWLWCGAFQPFSYLNVTTFSSVLCFNSIVLFSSTHSNTISLLVWLSRFYKSAGMIYIISFSFIGTFCKNIVTRNLYKSLGLRNFSLTMGASFLLSYLPYRNGRNGYFCWALTQQVKLLWDFLNTTTKKW